jgi:hypothetical protein
VVLQSSSIIILFSIVHLIGAKYNTMRDFFRSLYCMVLYGDRVLMGYGRRN